MRDRIDVAIRADASTAIGAGHVMRCLALGSALRRRGARVAFVCRERPGHLLHVIRSRGFEAFALPAIGDDVAGTLGVPPERDVAETLEALGGPVPRVVLDHYGAGEEWERAARAAGVAHLVVIDDLARRHDCDVLVDVNLSAAAMGHDRLVPEHCELLLGSQFALLGAGFGDFRHRARARPENQVERVLVSFGGGDVGEPTLRAVEALEDPRFDGLFVCVLLADSASRREEVAAAVEKLPHATLMKQLFTMPTDAPARPDGIPVGIADAMFGCDLALGAAGGQALERCCLGLPALVVTVAENQEAPAAELAAAGALRLLGRAEDVGVGEWRAAIAEALQHPESLRRMSRAAFELVDGLGATRVALAVLAGVPIGPHRDRVRPMAERDRENVWRWRNDEEVRRVMFSTREIPWEDHVKWFESRLDSSDIRPLVYESGGVPLGFVKFDRFPLTGRCEWGFYKAPEAPRGTGSRMGWLALTYAFENIDTPSILATVTDWNERSLRYHERMGFTRTGTSTREGSRGTVGVVEFALTAERWREVADRLRVEIFGE